MDYVDMLMVCYILFMNVLFELSCLSSFVLECLGSVEQPHSLFNSDI